MTTSIRSDIINVLSGKLNLSEEQIKDLEIGIYNSTIDYASRNKIPLSWNSELFQECYLSKARSMYLNLDNSKLLDRLEQKEFLPHEIPYMTPDNIDPMIWNNIIDDEMRRNKAAYEISKIAMTDQITCGRCKKKRITYYEMQTRSADEPASIFYNCLDCGNRWRC
jgi:DNA-directed RNA polymerase subunit M/transcription elongation factor TFIIS